LNDVAGARRAFEDALSKSPEDIRALDALTASYLAERQPDKALARVRQQVALRPGSAALQRYLGQFLLRSGDPAGARAAFQASKASAPQFDTELDLVRADILEKKFDTARQALNRILASRADYAQALLMLGMLEETTGNYPQALEQYQKAVDADATNVVALNNLAFCLAERANRLDEALRHAQRAKELAAESTPAVDDTLGWIYYRKGVYRTAVRHLEHAVKQEPTSRRKYHLAMAYFRSGDEKLARQTLQAAAREDSSLPEATMAREVFQGKPGTR
jgi:cellulose synthase operon protein C